MNREHPVPEPLYSIEAEGVRADLSFQPDGLPLEEKLKAYFLGLKAGRPRPGEEVLRYAADQEGGGPQSRPDGLEGRKVHPPVPG